MGMFDWIRCEARLRAKGMEGTNFQTKDTPRQGVSQYVIKTDGTLWLDLTPDEEDEAQPFTLIEDGKFQHDFNDDVYFYEYFSGGKIVSFSAKFVNGRTSRINLERDTRETGQGGDKP